METGAVAVCLSVCINQSAETTISREVKNINKYQGTNL